MADELFRPGQIDLPLRGRVVAAPDKFRGTATAHEVAAAVASAADAEGWICDSAPVADGGEGTLEALGGHVRTTSVVGPLGAPVIAEWRMDGDLGVVEMARASGLSLAGGPDGNDPLRASTRGTGQLITAALEAGAHRIIVGVGGSASTDGGLGAVTALGGRQLRGVDVVVACDVTTRFVDAAEHFAPQKGASAAQVALLKRRLQRLAQVYERDYGVDVTDVEGSGAAGGLAGGLAALGADLVPGFEVVADVLNLSERIADADLVVTGEGFLDEQSFRGKAVGGVAELAAQHGVPLLVVAGDCYVDDLPDGIDVVSLVNRFGEARARAEVLERVEEVVRERLSRPRPAADR
jgi:glycerate kinase